MSWKVQESYPPARLDDLNENDKSSFWIFFFSDVSNRSDGDEDL